MYNYLLQRGFILIGYIILIKHITPKRIRKGIPVVVIIIPRGLQGKSLHSNCIHVEWYDIGLLLFAHGVTQNRSFFGRKKNSIFIAFKKSILGRYVYSSEVIPSGTETGLQFAYFRTYIEIIKAEIAKRVLLDNFQILGDGQLHQTAIPIEHFLLEYF